MLDWYAKESGLALVTTLKPQGTFTFVPPKPGTRYTLADVTDIINEALGQRKLLLVRRKTTFFLHAAGEKLDPKVVRQVAVADLGACARSEIVEVSIPFVEGDAAEQRDELRKLLTEFGDIVVAQGRWLVVRDTAGNASRFVQMLKSGYTCGDTFFDPREGRGFRDAKWPEVFEAYEQATGLKGTIKSAPAGTFTFTHPGTPRPYRLDEFTDVINGALLVKGHLLIRSADVFVVVPADEKIDPVLVPRVGRRELGRRGRTELVQTTVPIPSEVQNELIPVIKKVLGPFGTVAPAQERDAVLVRDVAEKVLEVCDVLGVSAGPRW